MIQIQAHKHPCSTEEQGASNYKAMGLIPNKGMKYSNVSLNAMSFWTKAFTKSINVSD